MRSSGNDEFLQLLSSAYAEMTQRFEVQAEDVKGVVAARRRRSRFIALVSAAATVAVVGGIGWDYLDHPRRPDPVAQSPIGLVEVQSSNRALELNSSSTAHDWVSGADVVVLVKVVAEAPGPVLPADDGSGDQFVERSVQFEVQRQVWSRAERLGLGEGDGVEVSTYGWARRADGSTVRLAGRGTPRLEVGHTYVVALVATSCASSTAETRWSTLGSGAVIPSDGNRVGFGESEGRDVKGEVSQTRPDSLERQLLGANPSAVTSELDEAAADVVLSSPRSGC